MKAANLATVAAFSALLAPVLARAALESQQFRAGIELKVEPGHSVQELVLPDAVYQGARRADLGDLRVFNAADTPVPHAFCTAPLPTLAAAPESALPVFALQATQKSVAAGTHVGVDSQGAISVDTHAPAPGAAAVAAYIIDARSVPAPLQTLRLRWRSADGASEVHVRVDASADLDRWMTVVPETTLVHADGAGATLDRQRIELPVAPYQYLRIVRTDAGPQPLLDEVLAQAAPPESPEAVPTWFEAAAGGVDAERGWRFDSGRVAPVEIARILLPVDNVALPMALQSRGDDHAPWRTVWSGTVFAVRNGDGDLHSADLRFAADPDRQWRLLAQRSAESLAGAAPRLRLGYRPLHLRFLAEGEGPFLLAYGSVRAEIAAPPACDGLLPGLSPGALQAMIGTATAGSTRTLGGDTVLQPLPAPAPKRPILLWSLLLLGAVAVTAMAMNLLKAMRQQ